MCPWRLVQTRLGVQRLVYCVECGHGTVLDCDSEQGECAGCAAGLTVDASVALGSETRLRAGVPSIAARRR